MSTLQRRSARNFAQNPRQGPVLVLDPDRQIRALVCEWIEKAGYAPVQASGLNAASDTAAQCDIVLVDVRAPLVAARQMVESVLAVAPDAAIIAMSADGLGDAAAMQALERQLDVTAVLVKPFDRVALTQALDRARTWRP